MTANNHEHNNIKDTRETGTTLANGLHSPPPYNGTNSPIWSRVRGYETEPRLRDTIAKTEQYKKKLDRLHKTNKEPDSIIQQKRLIARIIRMTKHTLNAAASSIMLLDDKKEELVFEIAVGEAGRRLKRVRLSTRSGIAGWVASYCKPVIVNDVTRDQRFNKSVDEITGFVTKSIICVPLTVNHESIGVIEVLNKLDESDFSEQDLETLKLVASTAAISIKNIRQNQNLQEAYKSTLKTLAAAVDEKAPYFYGHSQRVTEYTLLGANSLSIIGDELEDLEYASILHDIGKISIADNILAKLGSLTSEEAAIVRKHPVIGANMLKGISFLENARRFILRHHERYDGTGYPDGLKGEVIPIGARLIAVADAFDSMTTDRPYRVASSIDSAIEELYRYAGTQFCPVAVEAFVAGFHNFYFPGSS